MTQKVAYPEEYKYLSANKSISSSSVLLNLNPYMSESYIIRCCGRLEASPGLSYDERHPIILPYNSELSKLLIQFIHQISLHGGNQLVPRLLRSQYWIPKAKNLIKKITNHCKPCVFLIQEKMPQATYGCSSIRTNRDPLVICPHRGPVRYQKLNRSKMSYHQGLCLHFCLL